MSLSVHCDIVSIVSWLHRVCFFVFCLGLNLISTTNGDFVSNVWHQRYQHSAILLTAPGVWDRSCCLWKAILVAIEMNLWTINKLKINKIIWQELSTIWLPITVFVRFRDFFSWTEKTVFAVFRLYLKLLFSAFAGVNSQKISLTCIYC